jgi:hypothetical protein
MEHSQIEDKDELQLNKIYQELEAILIRVEDLRIQKDQLYELSKDELRQKRIELDALNPVGKFKYCPITKMKIPYLDKEDDAFQYYDKQISLLYQRVNIISRHKNRILDRLEEVSEQQIQRQNKYRKQKEQMEDNYYIRLEKRRKEEQNIKFVNVLLNGVYTHVRVV